MKKRLSYILLFIATIIWGFAFVAQKAAVILPPLTVSALRSVIASAFLILIIPLTDKITKNGRHLIKKDKRLDFTSSELIGGLILGIIISIATALQQIGLEKTDAGKAAFITALYVVIVPIMSAILGKKPTPNVIISVPIAIVGFYLLCIKPGIGISRADILVLLCALVFAGHITAVDHLSPGCDGVRMSFVQFTVSFIINAILGVIFEGMPSGEVVATALPSLLFLGIASSGIAYTLQIIGQKDVEPGVASLLLSMEAVFGAIGGAIILGERMEAKEYIGCAIVLVAVLIAQTNFNLIQKTEKIKENDNNN